MKLKQFIFLFAILSVGFVSAKKTLIPRLHQHRSRQPTAVLTYLVTQFFCTPSRFTYGVKLCQRMMFLIQENTLQKLQTS